MSCFEAGRDGFWLHRYLLSCGIDNLVVDSSSIEVNRRYRRAKTDCIDAKNLLAMLIRYHGGERGMWSVVNVPSVQAEDGRHLHREWVASVRKCSGVMCEKLCDWLTLGSTFAQRCLMLAKVAYWICIVFLFS